MLYEGLLLWVGTATVPLPWLLTIHMPLLIDRSIGGTSTRYSTYGAIKIAMRARVVNLRRGM